MTASVDSHVYVNYDDNVIATTRPTAVPVSELASLVNQITNTPDILQQQFNVRYFSCALSLFLHLFIRMFFRMSLPCGPKLATKLYQRDFFRRILREQS